MIHKFLMTFGILKQSWLREGESEREWKKVILVEHGKFMMSNQRKWFPWHRLLDFKSLNSSDKEDGVLRHTFGSHNAERSVILFSQSIFFHFFSSEGCRNLFKHICRVL